MAREISIISDIELNQLWCKSGHLSVAGKVLHSFSHNKKTGRSGVNVLRQAVTVATPSLKVLQTRPNTLHGQAFLFQSGVGRARL
jgi:hypothetical protein